MDQAGEPARWARLQELFHAALECGANERGALLERELAGEPDLRREVERLLDAESRSSMLEPTADLGAAPRPFAALVPEDSLCGRRLGGFELTEEIGRGGAGVVYRAREVELGREVAVKLLPALAASPEQRERFRREARAVSRLDHPTIVRVLSFGEEQGLCFYAMDWVRGHGLDAYLDARRAAKGGAVPPPLDTPDFGDDRVAAAFVREVALALHHAHGRGIVHRDVKPQNLLVDENGRARLVDFGLARDAALGRLTRTGELAGTPFYMSPEQARAVGTGVDHRSDVYSLGAVLYEMLTLRPPSRGETLQAVLYSIVHERPRPVRSVNPAVPRALANVCATALGRRPQDRYSTAEEMADDLGRFLDGRSVHARGPRLAERVERRLPSRRAVLRAAPAVLLLGAGLGAAAGPFARAVAARGRRPLVRAILPPDLARQLVRVDVLAFDPARPDVAVPLGPAARVRGGEWGCRLAPGNYLMCFTTEDGRRAELRRSLGEGDEIQLAPRPALPVDDEHLARTVPAGTHRLDLSVQPLDGASGAYVTDVDLAGFRIERGCVTNGAYRRFLEASGRGTGDLPERWRTAFASPPREDWDELPVVGLTAREARDYAEWHGLRLPTASEWQRAAGGAGPAWMTDAERADPAAHFVVGRRTDRLAQDRGDFDEMLRHLGPALREAAAQGPFGLCAMVGDVAERIATPPFAIGPDGPRAYDDDTCWSMGYGWSHRAATLRLGGLRVPHRSARNTRDCGLGLRCVQGTDPVA